MKAILDFESRISASNHIAYSECRSPLSACSDRGRIEMVVEREKARGFIYLFGKNMVVFVHSRRSVERPHPDRRLNSLQTRCVLNTSQLVPEKHATKYPDLGAFLSLPTRAQ